ncbi:MAG: prepilin peptidase [Planctomycetota bacterium]|nr:MAG: prepilin peptidase [Planctomycetota bacterium]
MEVWEELRRTPWLWNGFLALFGAVAGSFASAAIYRLPREGLSLTRPVRSFCPSCGYRLRWSDNLPLLSYLLLRGRCRSCGTRIGALYLLNEVGLALLFPLAGQTWAAAEGPAALVLLLVALTALWIAAGVDFGHLELPDQITLGGVPFGLLAAALVPAFHLWQPGAVPWGAALLGLGPEDPPRLLALASAAVGGGGAFLLLFGIRALFSYLLGQEALGFGDVKLLAAVGCLVGLEGAAWTLMTGVVVGAVLGLLNILRMILVVHRRRLRRGRARSLRSTVHLGWLLGRQIPFGPPLVLGTAFVLLAPGATHHFYLQTWPEWIQSWIR